MEGEAVAEDRVKKASNALVAVRIWVLAMIKYSEVLKIVEPKKKLAAEMSEKLDAVMKNLNEKRA